MKSTSKRSQVTSRTSVHSTNIMVLS